VVGAASEEALDDAIAALPLEGRVVEQGKHEDLLALKGRYWTLLRRQQLEEEIEQEPAVARASRRGA
jgi:hypothetical protein